MENDYSRPSGGRLRTSGGRLRTSGVNLRPSCYSLRPSRYNFRPSRMQSTETDAFGPLVTLYVHWWHFTSIGWLDICVHRTIFQPSPKHWQLSRGFPTPKPKNFTWMEWKLRGIQYVWWELKWELPRWISRYTVLKKLHCQHNKKLKFIA